MAYSEENERAAEVERWLRGDVATAYDHIRAGESELIPAEEVFAALREHHAQRKKQSE